MPEFRSEDGQRIHYEVRSSAEEKAVIQILTGLGETAPYYKEFAGAAAQAGYSVYLHEYRKHGGTVADYGPEDRNLFDGFARDAGRMEEIIRREHPGEKIFLFGHSLGTAISQIAIAERYGSWDGLVMTGPSHLDPGDRAQILLGEAEEEAGQYGWDAPSRRIYPEIFDGLNAAFREEHSPFSFITSDQKRWEWIGALPSTSPDYSVRFFRDFVLLQCDLVKRDALERTAFTDLPVLLLAGSEDMTAEHGTYGDTKAALLEKQGFRDVTSKVYPGLRHSLLQETERGRVTADILSWLDARAAKPRTGG